MRDTHPTRIGHEVTVGHAAMLHGCTIHDRVLIGMGAMLLNGAEIGEDSIVAAGTLVPEEKKFPARSLLMGRPAVLKRELTDEEVATIRDYAERYVGYRRDYMSAQNESTQPARGMRDFLPEDVRRREYVVGIIRDVYDRYGFEPLETPAVENIETLLGKYGEEGNKLIFKILKRGEHEASGQADLALRYDLTVPLARVVARVPVEAAEVLQALPDSAGVAGRSSGARPLPRVLSVRHRQRRLDVAGRRSRTDRGRVERFSRRSGSMISSSG